MLESSHQLCEVMMCSDVLTLFSNRDSQLEKNSQNVTLRNTKLSSKFETASRTRNVVFPSTMCRKV